MIHPPQEKNVKPIRTLRLSVTSSMSRTLFDSTPLFNIPSEAATDEQLSKCNEPTKPNSPSPLSPLVTSNACRCQAHQLSTEQTNDNGKLIQRSYKASIGGNESAGR